MAKQKAKPDKASHRTDPQITRIDWDAIDWSAPIDLEEMGLLDVLQDMGKFEEFANSFWFAGLDRLEKEDATTN